MNSWPSTKARRVFAALRRTGWRHDRTVGSHKIMKKEGWADYPFSFHDSDELGPAILAKIAKKTGLNPETSDLSTDGLEASNAWNVPHLTAINAVVFTCLPASSHLTESVSFHWTGGRKPGGQVYDNAVSRPQWDTPCNVEDRKRSGIRNSRLEGPAVRRPVVWCLVWRQPRSPSPFLTANWRR